MKIMFGYKNKKMNLARTILLVFTTVQTVFSLAAMEISDEQYVRQHIGAYAVVSNFIWHAVEFGHSTCDYRSATFSARESLTCSLKKLVLEKFKEGNFLGGISVPSLVDQSIDSCPLNSYTWANPQVHVREIIPVLDNFIQENSSQYFDEFIENYLFLKAFNLASVYRVKDPQCSDRWLQQIQAVSTAKVENFARKVALFSVVAPDLEAGERRQSIDLIHSFPAGHMLRNHLQGRFDAVLVLPRPDVAFLPAMRQIGDRLFA